MPGKNVPHPSLHSPFVVGEAKKVIYGMKKEHLFTSGWFPPIPNLYLMYKSSLVGPQGSSKVIQLPLETH